MIKEITISLSGISNKEELFEKFNIALEFPEYFGYNWDAFDEVMQDLSTQSGVIKDLGDTVSGIHMILEDYDIFCKTFSFDDSRLFLDSIFHLCKNRSYRYDQLSFTFELRYSGDYDGFRH